MKNLIRKLLVSSCLIIITTIVAAQTQTSQIEELLGVEVDVPEINQAVTLEDRKRNIEKVIRICEAYNSFVLRSTELMDRSLEFNRVVVAQCEARNPDAILGKDARDAYLLVCMNRLTVLKKQSAKYSKIVDEMIQLIPVAKKMIKDGLLSNEQIEKIIAAERSQQIMIDYIEKNNNLKLELEENL